MYCKRYEHIKEKEIFKNTLSVIGDINSRLKAINHYRSNKNIVDFIGYVQSLMRKKYPNFHMHVSKTEPLNGEISFSKNGKMFAYIDGKQFEFGSRFIEVQLRPTDRRQIAYGTREELDAEISREEQIVPLTGLNATMYIEDEEDYRRNHVALDDESTLRRNISDPIVYSFPASNEISETEQ